MRLLLINPNISEDVSALIRDEARRSASAGTGIDVVTAPFGMAYIETRMEAVVGAYAALQLAAEHAPGHDAVVIAAFGDPGVAGIRELLPVPVIGLTEAALASACLLGARFSVIAISRRIEAWYRDVIGGYGLAGRMASIRALDRPLRSAGTVQQEHGERLIELAHAAVREDGADVIVLAGAPLAGLARTVQGRLPVPVVDGVGSAVRHAESLASLAPGAAREGGFAPPPEKPNAGLPESLLRALERVCSHRPPPPSPQGARP